MRRASALSTVVACTSAIILACLVCGAGASGQSTPSVGRLIKPLVTNRTPLDLPQVVGAPMFEATNDAGDYAFIAGDGSLGFAVFLRKAGSLSLTRVMQPGDAIPGIPQSRAESFYGIEMNATGVLAIDVVFTAVDRSGRAVLTYDNNGVHTTVADGDAIPGSTKAFLNVNMIGISDVGDVYFSSAARLGLKQFGNETALFSASKTGAIARMAAPGDAAAGLASGRLGAISLALATASNNRGEVAFTAAVDGGSGGSGLFVASTAGVRKVAATGDSDLISSRFSSSSSFSNFRLNDLGQVAFTVGSGGYLSQPTGEMSLFVRPGLALPPLGGTTSGFGTSGTAHSVLELNDAGTVLFVCRMSTYMTAVVTSDRYMHLQVAAYGGQTATPDGQWFSNLFDSISLNNAGDISFDAPLAPSTPSARGIFRKRAGGQLSIVALNGQAVPIQGGGTYDDAIYSYLLADGSVYFESYVAGGTATYGAFLAGNDGRIRPLTTDADPLPAGSTVSLLTMFQTGAGPYAGFVARSAGSGMAYFVHDTRSGSTMRVIGYGDTVPGGRMGWNSFGSDTVQLNRHGSVHIWASLRNGGAPNAINAYATTALFTWSPGGGIRRMIRTGDSIAGMMLVTINGAQALQSSINENDAIVFRGQVLRNSQGVNGIFVVNADTSVSKVVLVGDVLASGATVSSFGNRFLMNDAGDVAYQATTTWGTGASQTKATQILIKLAASQETKVVWTTQAVPYSSPLPTVNLADLNNQGQVLFFAPSSTGTSVLIGGADREAAIVAANGAAAPRGGNYAFTSGSLDGRINAKGDVLFQAPLAGGTSDSGWFLYRAVTAATEPVVLQGDQVPGSDLVFAQIPQTINSYPGEFNALADDGDLLVWAPTDLGSRGGRVMLRYRGPGTLEKLVNYGDEAPDSGGGIVSSFAQGVAHGDDGLFFLKAVAIGGSNYDEAIYATILDTTPPQLSVPSNMVVDATGPAGAFVTYQASANDAIDGDVPISCSPASGSLFPIGDTTVTCTASDDRNNTATATFTVHVNDALTQVVNLQQAVATTSLSNSLGSKLAAAQLSITSGETRSACGQLNATINEVRAQSGKKLTEEQGAAITSSLARVCAVIGCR